MICAVCDDESSVLEDFRKIILNIMMATEYDLQVEYYNNPQDFKQMLQTKSYDLIFLDIDMSHWNGVDIGNYIRNTMENNSTQIVFISNHTQYAMQLFQVRPMDFMIKPISQERIEQCIALAYKLKINDDDYFEYYVEGIEYREPVKEIIYFESNKRIIQMHTKSGVKNFYAKLDDLCPFFETHEFLRIHKSVAIAYRYTRMISYDSVLMTNGDKLSISQRYRNLVREKIAEYQFKKRG